MTHAAAKAFPLAWPDGRPRTKVRNQSRFGDRTVAKALAALKDEIARLNARYVVISTNIPLKDNGDPYSDPGKMNDPGVAVYFRLNEKPYCLPCDRWNTVEDNMYAVAKHIEAMRGMERWGVGTTEQTFAGFKELASDNEWGTVFGIERTASAEQIQQAYRTLARSAHPDQGGSTAAMQRLNVARDQGIAERAS